MPDDIHGMFVAQGIGSSLAWCGTLPLTTKLPEVGLSRSPISRSRVLLPQPDGPISETNSPGAMVRSMALKASTRSAPDPSNTLPSAMAATASAVPAWSVIRSPPPP